MRTTPAQESLRMPSSKRPLAITLANAVGTSARWMGLRPRLLDVDAMVESAKRETGLDDFGPAPFKDALRVLADSCNREANLNLVGEVALRNQFVRLLANRLRIEELLKSEPEIVARPLPRPLVIAGMPRTGTTLLHRLLAEDPRSRAPRLWEMFVPTPPPCHPDQRAVADVERYQRVVKMLDAVYSIVPEVAEIHPMQAGDADECHGILQHTFVNEVFVVQLHIPSYFDFILSLGRERMREVYAYHKQLMQVITARYTGDHLVLKWPGHLLQLDALLDVYPDACIIQTHRDPVEFVPSTCSLFAHGRATRAESVDLRAVGNETVRLLREAMQRSMRVRAEQPAERFFDLRYSDLMKDPIGTVQGIYEYFGFPFEPEFASNMKAWLAKNKSPTSHKYSLEQFGLSRADLVHEFADYCEQFGVSVNSGRPRAITPVPAFGPSMGATVLG